MQTFRQGHPPNTPYTYSCCVCGAAHTSPTPRAVCPSCVASGSRRLSDAQFRAWLERLHERIRGGLCLNAFDDTTPGDQSTSCSWGLCAETSAAYPDPQTWRFPGHTHPDNYGHVPVIQRARHHCCPLDRRGDEPGWKDVDGSSGCFYSCRVFQPLAGQRLTATRTLNLIASRLLQLARHEAAAERKEEDK